MEIKPQDLKTCLINGFTHPNTFYKLIFHLHPHINHILPSEQNLLIEFHPQTLYDDPIYKHAPKQHNMYRLDAHPP